MKKYIIAILCCSIFTAPVSSAHAQACSGPDNNADSCQYVVTSNSIAPLPAFSKGIRLNQGVQNVFFHNYVSEGIAPRFVDNNTTSDLFVPQRTGAEFAAFLQQNASTFTRDYAVPVVESQVIPAVAYNACTFGQSVIKITRPIPQDVSHAVTSPSTGLRYTRLPYNYRTHPQDYTTVLGQTSLGGPIEYSYTRNDCYTDTQGHSNCTSVKFLEAVKATVPAMKDPSLGVLDQDNNAMSIFKWDVDNMTLSSNIYVSTDGGSTYNAPNPYDCSKNYATPLLGVCGTAHGTDVAVAPSAPSALCAFGNPSAVTNTSGHNFAWTCNNVGAAGGASCATITEVLVTSINGACGTDNNKVVSATPTNLCAYGTPSVVTGDGSTASYTWTCNGIAGGSTASCSAPVMVHYCDYQDPFTGVIKPLTAYPYQSASTKRVKSVSVPSNFNYYDGAAELSYLYYNNPKNYTWVDNMPYTDPEIVIMDCQGVSGLCYAKFYTLVHKPGCDGSGAPNVKIKATAGTTGTGFDPVYKTSPLSISYSVTSTRDTCTATSTSNTSTSTAPTYAFDDCAGHTYMGNGWDPYGYVSGPTGDSSIDLTKARCASGNSTVDYSHIGSTAGYVAWNYSAGTPSGYADNRFYMTCGTGGHYAMGIQDVHLR